MASEAQNIFARFLKKKHLSFTPQRGEILRIFLRANRHLSVDELYHSARAKNKKIGHTTVFRTLRLLCEAGLTREVDLGAKVLRYELVFGHQHHDHLVCTRCGSFVEAMDLGIERLQDKLCKKLGFEPQRHKLEIYGICKKCR